MSYPRIASYGGYKSGGQPLVGADGKLDQSKVERLARYPVVVIHANALHLRPDIVWALRLANPDIKILPYVVLTHWWLTKDFVPPTSDISLNAELQRVYLRTNAFLPNPQLGYEIDWTNAAMAKGVADLYAMLAGSGLYDGLFLDFAYSRWIPGGESTVRNMRLVVDSVRDAGGLEFEVVANGEDCRTMGVAVAMHEGFPQPFTSFDNAKMLTPHDWLKCEDTNPRAGRFGYGTALLTGATFCWGPQRPDSFDGDRWLPEFGVDLGEPRGMFLKHESGVYMRWFDKGLVLVNPTWANLLMDLLVGAHAPIGGAVPQRGVRIPAMDAVVMTRAVSM